ncbi:MAG TPA: hypothetical protein VN132_07170 [Bdellovibrio sp.]|nr:hypothetical protein [Bdellovibrio sp.]
MSSPTDALFNQVGQISALATICEIKMRILADNNQVLTRLAHAQKLEEVENGIIAAFKKHLSTDEIERLKTGRVVRNKILHGNFEAASAKMSELEGAQLTKPSGSVLDLTSGEIRDIGSKPIKSSSIFEWLLALGSNRFMPTAMDTLQKNIGTIERLLEQSSKKEIEAEPI